MRNDPTAGLAPINPGSRYTIETGTIFATGVHAMLRVLLDQARADRQAGLKTAGLISGYPGSPLGGVDMEFMRNSRVFESADIYHQLGLNEELAATAIYGTQLIHDVAGARFDGVFGMWFGKSPGVDRAADAFHHANFHGTAHNGGVLVVAGDDPHARSTILPSDSNTIFSSFYMPVLSPGNVQEVLDFGRHGYALSRAACLWVGFKLISDIADSSGTVDVGLERVNPIIPAVEFDGAPFKPQFRPNEAGPPMIEREREIYYGRLEVARQYARLNGLNRIVVNPKQARRGILVAGKTYFDVREALRALDLDDAGLEAAGIRILKMGMVYPFDHKTAFEFADGLDEILVVEDKRPFLESFLKNALYGRPDAPVVIGKNDARGDLLLTACGELAGDPIKAALAKWLKLDALVPAQRTRKSGQTVLQFEALPETRTPYFCSGCPHNRSLKVPEGSVVGAGIGCHIMTLWMGPVMGEVTSYTQMGGEGAQWVGLNRFTAANHFFQNLGDGTFAHSGSLAIRFAVAAKINVTYKILYNSAVAMTGGQPVFGGKTVQGIVQELAAEGVKRIVVTTDEPERYRNIDLSSIAAVRHRDDLIEAEKELSATPGVTALINDQQCAAEKRRLRKRGQLERPPARVVINERICEGCGDCGVKSNCLSVEPVETEFGRKTRINQTSCNQDYSCLLGDCPSFMTIEGGRSMTVVIEKAEPPVTLVDPVSCVPEDEFSVFMAGIGGTGVVTVNQILGMAGALAKRSVRAMDETGSSQKAGPVVSHLRISKQPREGATRIMAGSADLFLAFDLLTASQGANLTIASPERTIMVANVDAVPTGGTVTNVGRSYPQLELLRTRLRSVTRAGGHMINALALSKRIFGNETVANMLLVGAAYQAGAIPLPQEAIEAAIRMNGVSVDINLRAFRWGRCAVQAPEAVEKALHSPDAPDLEGVALDPEVAASIAHLGLGGEVFRRVKLRAAELAAYQDAAYAAAYIEFLQTVCKAETRYRPGRTDITEAVALNLYKLMAYKDEYEVARFIVDAYDRQRASGEIGDGGKVRWLLHPTFLRTLGLRKKVGLGRWFVPIARILARMKNLRGTRFDLLGYTHVRRAERSLISLYKSTMLDAIGKLGDGNYNTVAALAALPDMIRGYEHIKLRNIEAFERRRLSLMAALSSPVQQRSTFARGSAAS